MIVWKHDFHVIRVVHLMVLDVIIFFIFFSKAMKFCDIKPNVWMLIMNMRILDSSYHKLGSTKVQ